MNLNADWSPLWTFHNPVVELSFVGKKLPLGGQQLWQFFQRVVRTWVFITRSIIISWNVIVHASSESFATLRDDSQTYQRLCFFNSSSKLILLSWKRHTMNLGKIESKHETCVGTIEIHGFMVSKEKKGTKHKAHKTPKLLMRFLPYATPRPVSWVKIQLKRKA